MLKEQNTMNQDSNIAEIQPQDLYAQDEIDLFELAAGLWSKKRTISGITLATLLAGVFYIATAPSMYLASTQIRPPNLSDLLQINETLSVEHARAAAVIRGDEGKSLFLAVTPHIAFQRATFELESPEIQNLVLNEILAANEGRKPEDICEEEEEDFVCYPIGIELPKTGKNSSLQISDSITVTVSHHNPEMARDLLNEHIRQANTEVVHALAGEIQGSLAARIVHLEAQISRAISMEQLAKTDAITRLSEADEIAKLNLRDKIAALKKKALQLRLDKISTLEEAYDIASSLSIKEPISLTQLSHRQEASQGAMAISADFSNRRDPSYLRGTRMLSAEIAALKNRKSDDFTIPEIRKLEEQLSILDTNREIQLMEARKDDSAFVSNIGALRTKLDELQAQSNQDYNAVRALRVVQPAMTPKSPVKPRKKLILAICLFAGGFLGTLVALVMVAADKHKAG